MKEKIKLFLINYFISFTSALLGGMAAVLFGHIYFGWFS